MEKLYYIFIIINESYEPVPAKDIKRILLEKYGITIDIKTIYTMIRNINELFFLFCQKKLIKTIRRVGYCIDEELFADGQLQYLIDSVLFNQDMNDEEADAFLKILTSLSSSRQLARLNFPQTSHHDHHYAYLLNLTTIIKAIHEKRNVFFKYVYYEIKDHQLSEVYRKHGNDKDNPELYIVSPYKIIQRDSKYYLLAYFGKRPDQLSIYRLDRMRLVRNHKSPFVDIQEQYDFESELDKNINMYLSGYRAQLEIVFDQTIIREVVDHFGFDCQVTKNIDDQYILTADNVLISEGLTGWLMMLQNHVKVIRPLQLKEEMLRKIEQMKKMYM